MVERALCFLYLLIISVCDIRTRRIPNCITGGLFAGVFCRDIFLSSPKISEKLLCGFFFLIVFGLVSVFTIGLGMGDAKLAAVLGYCLGFFNTIKVFVFASLFGIMFFLLLAFCRKDLKKLPFVPFVFLGYALSEVVHRRLL